MRLRRLLLAWPLAIVALSASMQAAMPPSVLESLAALRAGNAAFAADPAEPWAGGPDRGADQRSQPAPLAAVLSCAEPTAPAEVLFRARPGSLFVIRTAGPIVDQGSLAALEYAVDQLHTPLLVVMGHEACGIVRSSLGDGGVPTSAAHFDAVRKKLRAATSRTAPAATSRIRFAVLEAVEEQINELLQASATLRRAAEGQALTLVGAYYEHSSGVVHFSQPVHVMAGDGARPSH